MPGKDARDVISTWLSHRASIPAMDVKAISNDLIAEIAANPREGIKKLLGKEPKAHRLRELKRLLENVVIKSKPEVLNSSGGASAKQATENVGGSFERMQRAVDEAVELGIVQQEFFPAKIPTSRTAYILASTHYDPDVRNSNYVDPLVKMSQVELFQLTVLMQRAQVPGRILVEGVQHIDAPVPRGRILLPTDAGDSVPLQSPAQQEYFFSHPTELIQIIDHLLSTGKGHIPLFYRLSSFPFDGAESEETSKKADALLQRLPRSFKFNKTLKKIEIALSAGTTAGAFDCTTLEKDGDTYLDFGNGCVVLARLIQEEAKAHLATMAEWNDTDNRGEEDFQTFLLHSPVDTVPIGWMGKAHGHVVAEALQNTMNVRLLTPRSSIYFDARKMRENRDKTRKIDLTTRLLQAANQALEQESKN